MKQVPRSAWMTAVWGALVVTGTTVLADPPAVPPEGAAGPLRREALAEVTVTANRIRLQERVAKFVNQIAARENGEGLPRWRSKVCPQVSGLPREEGEFVLGRISEIARDAGVPLADERCRPNLFVVVTQNPRKVLEGNEHSGAGRYVCGRASECDR